MKQIAINWILYGGGSLVLSAAVRALPSPEPMGSRFYAWFYRFTQLVMANLDKTGK